VRHPGVGKGGREYGPPVSLGEPLDDDEFPPRRPFGVPARPVLPAPDEDDDGATPRPATGASRCQPPATPS
jgi:hypothetical protein